MVSFCFNCGLIRHEVKYCDKPRNTVTQDYQYREWLKARYRKPEEFHKSGHQGQTLVEPEVRPNTVTRVMPQTDSLTAEILGKRFENSKNHGTTMVISTVHVEDKEVNMVSGFLKYKDCVYQPKGMAVQTKDKSENLVIKESAEIVANPVDIVADVEEK